MLPSLSFSGDYLSGPPSPAYLYGMSVRFDWLCECGTRGAEDASRTPQTVSSWALPDRLRSLPLRLPAPPPLPPLLPILACCKVLDVGVEVEETFFLAWPPKPKNLERSKGHFSRRFYRREITEGLVITREPTSSFVEVARQRLRDYDIDRNE